MGKLIISADLHGNLSSWLTLKNLLTCDDTLVIAGDLFDTKYGDRSDKNFAPESIRDELIRLNHPFYYVYGNCDSPSFFPGYCFEIIFNAFGNNIYLTHGHGAPLIPEGTNIIIQGHTHLCSLEKKESLVFMNPGSMSSPRNGTFTYGIIEKTSADIIDLKTGEKILSVKL